MAIRWRACVSRYVWDGDLSMSIEDFYKELSEEERKDLPQVLEEWREKNELHTKI